MHATVDPMLDPELLQPETVRPLARREYDQLVELGVFEDERVELLRGVLVTMSPQGAAHSGLTAWFMQRLTRATDESYDVRAHSPFAADDYSEPEPDVSVSLRDDGPYHHPTKLLLLIEVADSSLRKDRRVKLPIYAEAGVPEYWIVDVNAQAIEVHTHPVDGVYTSVVRFEREGVLRPVAVPGVEIEVSSIRWT
jgi:Uma2 family endonuclease